MLAWATIKPALIELFSSIAVDPIGEHQFSAQWQGRARVLTDPAYRCDLFLRVTSVVGVGNDEVRKSTIYDDDDNVLGIENTVYGHRRIILRVEAEAHDDADDISAMHVIERVRTRLSRPAAGDALQAVKMSITDIGPALDTTYKHAGREKPRATMDVTLLGVVIDTDPVLTNWIQQVLLTSQLIGEDGNELPQPPNVTDWKLPDDDQVFHRSIDLIIPALVDPPAAGSEANIDVVFAEAVAGDGAAVNLALPAGVAIAGIACVAGIVRVRVKWSGSGGYAGATLPADIYLLRSRDLTP